MLLGRRGIDPREVEKLEVRYLANKEHNLLFRLFTDYRDADSASSDADDAPPAGGWRSAWRA